MQHEKKLVPVTYENGETGELELMYPVREKDKVIIVGCATSKDIVDFNDESAEYWGVNNLYGVPLKDAHYDRWFEIHNLWQDPNGKLLRRGNDEFRGQPVVNYMEGLGNIGCTVYMQKHWPGLIPTSIPYPLKEIVEHFSAFGLDLSQCRYLTNTITYEIVLAIYLGFKDIEVWGVDMSAGSEYEWQRPSCEFWLGVAAGMGIRVHIPPQADLLKCRFLYGFEEAVQRSWHEKLEKIRVDTKVKRMNVEHQITQLNEQKNQYLGCEQTVDEIRKIWANLEDDLVVQKRGAM